ncbi:PD-(D/E)XK nuclease family protein [Anthocerotibacter panamensis]|uniref:PD-(D/E)XK nuclease family protein n=1 Tax=Anthocerotibacter panamensis TaxID=2857077 RepID=UPI001C406DC8|nr:PD-(D/E)XK nuclease family protein [Anthocerotibacter panamensis]
MAKSPAQDGQGPKPKGRHFKINGHYYPGVSTILRATQSYEKIQALARWRAQVGYVEAQRITQEATARGSLLHKLTETYFKGEDVALQLERATVDKVAAVSPFWNNLQTFLPRLGTPFLVESLVWHPVGHYAGKVDLACYWEEEGQERYPVVLDWKTSRSPKRLEYLEDHCLQLAAYADAINQMHETQVSQGILVISSPEALQVFQVDLSDYWPVWLQRLYRFWRKQRRDHPLAEIALAALAQHAADTDNS